MRVYAVSGGSRAEVEGDVWTVPEERQAKGKATPRVPLSPQALACLHGLGVPATTVRGVVRNQPFTLHGFRACFRSWCEREGVRFEVAEHQLGHKLGNQVERAYQRDDLLDERREAMRRWAD